MTAHGHTAWAIPGGHIPLNSTGHEPEYTSNEKLCILNTADEDADVRITIFYQDREPVGPYALTVKARRVRQVRFNDLIEPEAMPLDTDYAALVESDIPVVVQFIRQDTSQPANALFASMAFPLG